MSQPNLLAFLLISTQISLVVIFALLAADVESVGQNSSSLYEKLCIEPGAPSRSVTFTFKTLDNASKWYVRLANDIGRHYFGSGLKGKMLARKDVNEYEGICLEGNKPFAQLGKIGIGTENGFGKLGQSVYTCTTNEELSKSVKCLHYNSATKFHYTDFSYFLDTESENVNVLIDCFPNNETGWLSVSPSPTLRNEEYTAVKRLIVSLGFDGENIVQTHDEKCNNI